jgi:hypothetical protein
VFQNHEKQGVAMADREKSAAFVALPKSGRKVLAAIEKAIGDGDCAAVSYVEFMHIYRVGRPTISAGLKALDGLGFIEITPGPRSGNVFRLSNRWASIDASEAARLVREARKMLPQRRHEKRREPVEPVPVKVIEPVDTGKQFSPPPEVRTPSLPTLRWLDAR